MSKLDQFLSVSIEEISLNSFGASGKRCIFFVFEAGELVYVGQSLSVDRCLSRILRKRDALKDIQGEIETSFILLPEREEYLAELLARYYVWKFKPPLNKPAFSSLDELAEFEKELAGVRSFPELEFLGE